MDVRVGDILTLKKQHPCGSKEWEVLRIGADFRLKCKGCDHQIMIPRPQAEKNIRNIQRKEEADNQKIYELLSNFTPIICGLVWRECVRKYEEKYNINLGKTLAK